MLIQLIVSQKSPLITLPIDFLLTNNSVTKYGTKLLIKTMLNRNLIFFMSYVARMPNTRRKYIFHDFIQQQNTNKYNMLFHS